MTEEENPVSEGENKAEEAVVENQQSETGEAVQEEKMVPLKALQAEKRKRQEAVDQNNWFKEQAVAREQQVQPQAADDSEELMTKGELRNMSSAQRMQIKREVLEESFLATNPDALETINTELEDILNKRPFLAQAIQSSTNRYSAAWQIVQDYTSKPLGNMTQKMKENEKKPGSPATVGRSGQMSSAESLSKMSNTEFKEYRQKLRAKG